MESWAEMQRWESGGYEGDGDSLVLDGDDLAELAFEAEGGDVGRDEVYGEHYFKRDALAEAAAAREAAAQRRKARDIATGSAKAIAASAQIGNG